MNLDELPDFPLAPWELPPNSTEPLVAPATLRWNGTLFGRETSWLVRVTGQEPFGQAFLCAEDSLNQAKWRLNFFGPRGMETQEDWHAAILAHIHKSSYCRITFFSDEDRNWHLRTNVDGSSQLRGRVKGTIIEAVEMNWPFDFACATSAQIHAEVLRSWDDESSDLNFARRWSSLSEDEKYALLVIWKRGDATEFSRAMKQVLRTFGPQLSPHQLTWFFYPKTATFGCCEVINGDPNDEFGLPLVLQEWGRALMELFGPKWNEELSRQHRCAQDQHSHGGSHFHEWTDALSAHEQLEVALQLSAWLDEREVKNELDSLTLSRLRDTLI